jgi:thymidylate synthase
MKQYHDLLKSILEKGTIKSPARENMPSTKTLFGYQMRFDLSEGFPMLTTKKLSFKNIVIELLWFLKGDTNIKYLVDNGCNIWNEDGYNFYIKKCREQGILQRLSYEQFVDAIKNNSDVWGDLLTQPELPKNYVLGDCGKQYGYLWRRIEDYKTIIDDKPKIIDQLDILIKSLKNNPESRRHIITAWNPATLDDMALNACHSFVQFNCRKLTSYERENYYALINNFTEEQRYEMNPNASDDDVHQIMDDNNIPKYYLDCQMYQRSCDVFLGCSYNTVSYSLLTHIIAKMCNMIVGDFIHTFGDVHIYDNHMDAVNEILTRDVNKYPLPNLIINSCPEIDWQTSDLDDIIDSIIGKEMETFKLENYQSYPTIKAELSTGLIK